jgi:hypothetical protein
MRLYDSILLVRRDICIITFWATIPTPFIPVGEVGPLTLEGEASKRGEGGLIYSDAGMTGNRIRYLLAD